MNARALLDSLYEGTPQVSIRPARSSSDDKACRSLFKRAGLNVLGGKTPGLVAVDAKDRITGCTFHETRTDDEGDSVYDFDLAVDPKAQNGVVGYLLAQHSVQEAKDWDCDVIKLWVTSPQMEKMLARLFHFQYADQDELVDDADWVEPRIGRRMELWLKPKIDLDDVGT